MLNLQSLTLQEGLLKESYIHSGSEYRVLIEIQDYNIPDDFDVAFSGFEFLWNPNVELTLNFYPLTTDWDVDNVSWTYPWINPGGDFNEEVHCFYALRGTDDDTVRVDLTDIFQYWNGDGDNFGIIVIFQLWNSGYIPPGLVNQFLNRISNAVVKIELVAP